jgi:hypothetical protein
MPHRTLPNARGHEVWTDGRSRLRILHLAIDGEILRAHPRLEQIVTAAELLAAQPKQTDVTRPENPTWSTISMVRCRYQLADHLANLRDAGGPTRSCSRFLIEFNNPIKTTSTWAERQTP